MSHLRREGVVCDLNEALLPIVGDDANFKEAAPLLFGTEFAKKGKEMVKAIYVPPSPRSSPSFKRPVQGDQAGKGQFQGNQKPRTQNQ